MPQTTTNTTELLQTQVAKILTKPLEQASLFLASGPTLYDTSRPLRIPALGGPTEVTWVGESEEIPDDEEVEFDEVTLLPSTMRSLKTIIRCSNELFRQSVISLDQAIQNRVVTDVAAKLDQQLFSASGDGVTTPQGMFAWAGTQEVEVDGVLDYDDLLTAWGMALSAHVNTRSMKWVMRPETFVALRKVKDGYNRYMIEPDVTLEGAFRLFGNPVVVTNRIPNDTADTPDTGRMALVDFSQIAVARDLAPTVTVLKERYAEFDETALRIVARYDAKPVNPQAVVTLTGITI